MEAVSIIFKLIDHLMIILLHRLVMSIARRKRNAQTVHSLLKCLIRYCVVFQCRIQVLPNIFAGHSYYCILFRKYHHVLSKSTACHIGIFFAKTPDLIPITRLKIRRIHGVRRWIFPIGHLAGYCFSDPVRIQKLLTIPFSILQKKLTDLGIILSDQHQSPAANWDVLRAFFPPFTGNSQRCK